MKSKNENRLLQRKERQLQQLNQQLEEQEQMTAEIQQTIYSLQRQVEQLQQQLKMTLNWRDGGKAPFNISRRAAVVDGDMAYFMNWNGEACSYKLTRKKWSKLPKCPYENSSLAVINGQVTAIGGCKNIYIKDTYTNKLLSLPGYTEVFPAMPTKR